MQASAQRAARLARIVAISAASLLVALVILNSVLDSPRPREAQPWVATPCKVQRVNLRKHSRGGQTIYYMHAVFEYEYEGKTYRTSRDALDEPTWFSEYEHGRDWFLKNHRPGRIVQCFVDPASPDQAVVVRREQPSRSNSSYLLPVLMLFLLLLMLTRELQMRRKE